MYIARFIVLYIIGAKIRIFLGLCKSGREIFYGEFREFREIREFKEFREEEQLESLVSCP